MKKTLLSIRRVLREIRHETDIQQNPQYRLNRICAELIRNVHSIEKGLSIRSPRLGYGVKKLLETFRLAEEYMRLTQDRTVVFFAADAISEYLRFHKEAGYTSADLDQVAQRLTELEKKIGSRSGCFGGTLICRKESFPIEQVERLFATRHSIRCFSGEPVPEEKIRKAIAMAQRAPSACNRQAVRVYSIQAKDYLHLAGNMEGIGGFAHDADRFLLITGIESAYRKGERMQFVVSASMFAAYLSLALHGLGIGSCAVQRPLYESDELAALRKQYNLPGDEQIVVMLAIGMMNDEMKVPVSRRLELDSVYRNLSQ